MKNYKSKKVLYWATALMLLGFYFILRNLDSNIVVIPNSKTAFSEIEKPKSTAAMPPAAIEQFVQMTANPKLKKRTPKNLLKIREKIKSGNFKIGKVAEISSWEERGPTNVAGRTRALLVDQNDASGNTLWAGSVSGGLWKTNNFQSEEVTWSPVNDFFQNIAVSSIAQDPSNFNVMYFGTGEGWFNSDASRGLGIWKTVNGGQTWEQMSSTNNDDFSYVQKIVVTAQGHLFAGTRNDGIQRSLNGGSSWTKVLGGGTGGAFSNRAADIEIAKNGDLYATLGIFSTDGIYKSTDGGSSWTGLMDGAPNNGLPNEGFQRIEIATAPSNENVVYALLQSEDDLGCMGIYRTNDGGTTWSSLSVPETSTSDNFATGQAWYDLIVQVDPLNDMTVYIGGIDLLRSIDGGTSWTPISHWYGADGLQHVHADQHSIQFFPGENLRAVVGNDGGVYSLRINQEDSGLPPYCMVDHRGFFGDFITEVELGDLTHESGRSTAEDVEGYSDHTNISTTLVAGNTYTLNIRTGSSFELSKAGAWIDWNGDHEFSSEEQILMDSGFQPYQASFTIPVDAKHLSTRLRVRMQYGEDYIPDPCAHSGFLSGETEDYTINVQNCIQGTACNDNDNCTVNDAIDASCNCVGQFFDENGDDLCDYLPTPNITAKNNNYNVTQFYSTAIHPEAGSNVLLGGTQDNGTHLFSSDGLNQTSEITGGDGGFCFIDQDEPNIHISTYIFNTIHITTDAWGDYQTVEIGDDAGYFINPMDYDSKTNTLFSSYNAGYFGRIRNVGSQNNSDSLEVTELNSLKISAVKVDPNVENRVWVASVKESSSGDSNSKARIIAIDNADHDTPIVGKVVEISDEHFTENAYTRAIEICPDDPMRMMVLFSNYGIPNIWATDDQGESWSNVDGNLPDIPVYWVLFNPLDKAGAIIATEMGIWSTDKFDGDDTLWELMNEGLANVRVDMLKYRPSDQTIVAATHGRGIFTSTLTSTCDPLAVTANLTHASCNGGQDGSISFDDQSLNYSWSTGDEESALNNLGVGTYHVTISTEESCHYVQSYTIEEASTMEVSDILVTNELCSGQSNGTVTLLVAGGQGTLSYNWSNGDISPSIDELAPGEYFVTVTDEGNCTLTTSTTVLAATPLGVVVEQTSEDEAIATPSGGAPPYSFHWSDGDGQTSQTAVDLAAGNYSVSVTDVFGCMITGSIEIENTATEELELWDVLAAAGQSYSSADLQVDWTIGEVMVDHRVSNAASISEGFHQMFNGGSTSTNRPDFTVSSLILNSSESFLGASLFRIDYDLSNIGSAGIPEGDVLSTKIYLSTDEVADAFDLQLNAFLDFELHSGFSKVVSSFVNFSDVQDPGEYYIIVHVNDDASIEESDFSNNTVSEKITILDPVVVGPDFDLISFSVSRDIMFPGESEFGVGSAVVKNSGTLSSPTEFSAVFLSEDEIIDADDAIVGFASFGELLPGDSDTASFSITINETQAVGDYKLLLCVDEFDSVVELQEDNNCAVESIRISGDGDRPDLIVSDIVFNYDEYFPGDRPFPYVHLLNQGNSTAFSGVMRHSIYISKDMTPSDDDIVRIFFTFENFLPGQPIVDDVLLFFDEIEEAGNYYIIGVVDSDNRVIESDEANNVFITEITIRNTALKPDLIVSEASVSNTLTIGGQLESSSTLSNIGDYKIAETVLGIYLTKDDSLGENAIRIRTLEVPLIEAGASVDVNTSFDIPSDIDPGVWNVIFAGDAFFRRYEANEENNTFVINDVNIGASVGAAFNNVTSQDEEYQGINLYPNPTSGNIFVKRNSDHNYKYEIMTADGKRIEGGTISSDNELHTNALTPGLYWFVYKDETGKRNIHPFVKM